MKYWLSIVCLIIIGVMVQWFNVLIVPVFAESLSVSLRVGDTRIQFSGFTSPGAFITVKQNNIVISTMVADSSGAFDQTIDAANPGLQTFTLHATDSLGLTTPTLSYNVSLTSNTLTSIANIVFPPTILLNTTTSVISGMSHPLSELTLILSDSSTYPITVTATGNWSFDLTTLPGGTYTAYVIATMPGNIISLESEVISFSLASVSTSSPTSTTPSTTTYNLQPTTSQAPSSSPTIKVTKKPITSPSTTTYDLQPTTSSPLTTFLVTVAKPISVMYFGAPLILIMILTRFTLFKKHKKKRK